MLASTTHYADGKPSDLLVFSFHSGTGRQKDERATCPSMFRWFGWHKWSSLSCGHCYDPACSASNSMDNRVRHDGRKC